MEGKPVEGLLWAPRLDIWYKAHKTQGTFPEKYQGKDLMEIETMLGAVAGSSARLPWKQRTGQLKGHIMQQRFNTVEIEKKTEGNKEYVTYKTPMGSVSEMYLINHDAIEKGLPMQKHLSEHLIKEEKDYEIVEHLYQDITYTPTYEDYIDFENALGDHGVPIVQLDRDPMYLIMQNLIGYNRFFYEFHDHKKKVEHLYQVVCEKAEEYKDIAVNSPAKILLAAYHYDSYMISPQFYDEYMKPYLKPFAVELKKRKKNLGLHADANTRGLLRNVLETEITFIDCFATAPLVKTTFEEAVQVWEDKVVIYGGIPANMLIPSICSIETFEDYLTNLFKTIKTSRCRIILGIADLVMPEADMERVEKISGLVEGFS